MSPFRRPILQLKKSATFLLLPLFDAFSLFLLLYLSFQLRSYLFPLIIPNLPEFLPPLKKYLWIVGIHLALLFYEGAYTKRFTFWDEVRMLWKATLLSLLFVLFVLFALKQAEFYSRLVIFTWFFLTAIIFPIIRINIKKLLFKLGLGKAKILIIGAGEKGISFLRILKDEPNLGYEVAGFLDSTVESDQIEGYRVFRYVDSVERYIKNADISALAITVSEKNGKEISEIILKTRASLDAILYVPDLKEIPVTMLDLRYFFKEDIFAFEIKNSLANPLKYFLKRTFDYTITLLFLPFALFLILFFSALIKITSPGPAIFSQERVGKNGKPFKCYKLRTMYVDAEKRLKEILKNDPAKKEEWERNWKLKEDPRVTPLGKFLRQSSLDELPQIFNVLKGEMSLIGPRPYLPREIPYLGEESYIIHNLPPGITGLWQVSGRSNTSFNERIALDSWYVRNWSLWLDIVILLKTIKVVLKKEGAF